MATQTKKVEFSFWPAAFVVTLVFFILKVAHVIDWSWWWVFSPLLIVLALSLVLITIGVIVLIFGIIVTGIFRR